MAGVAPVSKGLDEVTVQAVGSFVRWATGEEIPVVRGWVNAVSRPVGPYAMVTPMSMTWNATTTRRYGHLGHVSVGRSQSRTVQVDIYGPEAERHARTVATLWQDLTGCDFLKPFGVAPLTVAGPSELTEARGNEQAEPRWMLELVLQPPADLSSVDIEIDAFTDVILGLHPQA